MCDNSSSIATIQINSQSPVRVSKIFPALQSLGFSSYLWHWDKTSMGGHSPASFFISFITQDNTCTSSSVDF